MAERQHSGGRQVNLATIDPEMRPASLVRDRIDPDVVTEYALAFDDLPPIRLARVDGALLVIDGLHRIAAARQCGRETILATVEPMTYEQAFAAACRANETHGLRRSNADKRKSVVEALKLSGVKKWSNVRIAELCGISDEFVRQLRRTQPPTVGSSGPPASDQLPTVRIGKDGKARRLPPKRAKRQGDEVTQATIRIAEAIPEPEAPRAPHHGTFQETHKLKGKTKPLPELDVDNVIVQLTGCIKASRRIARVLTEISDEAWDYLYEDEADFLTHMISNCETPSQLLQRKIKELSASKGPKDPKRGKSKG
jgi:hypothetical protein